MSVSPPISLQFSPKVRQPIRSRIHYAFRVFAAVYDHAVIAGDEGGEAIRCFYGEAPLSLADQYLFHIPSLYRENLFENGRGALTKHRYAEEDFYLACGMDAGSGRPDWLAEIFFWLSSSYEASINARDSVGRISYSEMIFEREGISPRKPYAALLMAWLENALYHGSAKEALPKAPSPVSCVEHLVVCSHDIDFYYVDRSSAMVRLVKNLAVAILHYHSWSFFFDSLKMMLQLLRGKRIGEYLPVLTKEAGGEYGFESTLFVVTRQGHRRDPNYRLEQIAGQVADAVHKGFSVGVHGSYRSVLEDRTLREEAKALSDSIGGSPVAGSRQHWLRFAEHPVLFGEIERAGLAADSTLGFSETVGFRNGACFAFPPYDFAHERPHQFLEIPQVLMDGGLETVARTLRKPPQELAEEVLGESRRYGWGGMSVIWHNPIEPLSVPAEINAVFWNCAKQQKALREKWMSVDQFLACSLERYQKAGLLQGLRNDGECAASASENPRSGCDRALVEVKERNA